MDLLRTINLVLRFALEIGALVAAGYWGATISTGVLARAAAAVCLPMIIAFFWAAFVSPKAWIPTGPLGRAGLGLVVFLGAAALLIDRQHMTLAAVYGTLAVVSSLVVYALPQ
jgi:uncharacterized protein DUF2568